MLPGKQQAVKGYLWFDEQHWSPLGKSVKRESDLGSSPTWLLHSQKGHGLWSSFEAYSPFSVSSVCVMIFLSLPKSHLCAVSHYLVDELAKECGVDN